MGTRSCPTGHQASTQKQNKNKNNKLSLYDLLSLQLMKNNCYLAVITLLMTQYLNRNCIIET